METKDHSDVGKPSTARNSFTFSIFSLSRDKPVVSQIQILGDFSKYYKACLDQIKLPFGMSTEDNKSASTSDPPSWPKQKRPDWVQPLAPPLTREEVEAAIPHQIGRYPRVVRTLVDPPIGNQLMTNVSFILFPEAQKLKNGKRCLGFFKARGTWPTDEVATNDACRIIREVDSKYKIRLSPVGNWLPIVDDDCVSHDVLDVRNSEDEKHLQDKAVKEKEGEHRRIMREINERMQECQDNDIYDNPESVRYYSMKRVTEKTLTDEILHRTNALEGIKKSLHTVRKELKKLEKKFPDYPDQWVDVYNQERAKGGLPPYFPNQKQFQEYDNYNPAEHKEYDD